MSLMRPAGGLLADLGLTCCCIAITRAALMAALFVDGAGEEIRRSILEAIISSSVRSGFMPDIWWVDRPAANAHAKRPDLLAGASSLMIWCWQPASVASYPRHSRPKIK